MESFSIEERIAASAVALLGSTSHGVKRGHIDEEDVCERPKKMTRMDVDEPEKSTAMVPVAGPRPSEPSRKEREGEVARIQDYPFFFYHDFSAETDPDPLTPLTSPGRVPNFPAKMHSILSRPDLADVVAWMPHGRAWRVLKPREFEIRVIPTYFEHAKFSSFIRQANGWGFRRVTQGRDRNSYYHELFLRGLPHLCKKMKRPGVAEKKAADPEHEPDFYKISEFHPVPDKADDDSILLQCTLNGGPKARMPIYAGQIRDEFNAAMNTNDLKPRASEVAMQPSKPNAGASIFATKLTPKDQLSLNSFHQSISASEQQFGRPQLGLASDHAATTPGIMSGILPPQRSLLSTAAPSLNMFASAGQNKLSALAAANQLALMPNPQVAAAVNASSAANAQAQFAAGFAAATAYNQQQLRNLLGSLAATDCRLPRQQPRGGNIFNQNPFC